MRADGQQEPCEVFARLLGPLDIQDLPGTANTGPGAPTTALPTGRQRTLFAALLLDPGQVFSRERLVDLVWEEKTPRGPGASLRTCVMRLRRTLSPAWRARLVTRSSGLELRAEPEEVDWHCFRLAHQRGAAAVRARRWPALLAETEAALALWHGPALVDIPSQRLRDEHVGHMDEARAQIHEWRYDALLALGRHQDVTGDIHRTIGRHPLREHLRAHLMLALYRDHRDAEALAAYQETRALFQRELGTEPSERLQSLHAQILRRDPALRTPSGPEQAPVSGTATSTRSDSGPGPEPTPEPAPEPASGKHPSVRGMPLPSHGFVGRAAELARLDKLLDPSVPGADSPSTQGSPAQGGPAHHQGCIVLVTGMGGFGKTALATHWAQLRADRFPDGLYFLSLQGFDPVLPATSLSDALNRLLALLHVPTEQMPQSVEDRTQLYRKLMAGRRALLVLDSARDADQVRALLPGSRDTFTLVTSRNQMPGLAVAQGAGLLPLGLMERHDIVALLEGMAARGQLSQNPEGVERLLELCGGMPLITRIVGAQAALAPQLPLTTLCEQLESEPDVLDRFETGDETSSIRLVLDGSYAGLSPEAARHYRLLGLRYGSQVTLGSVAAMAGAGLTSTRRILNELIRSTLLHLTPDGLYRTHDLVRAHALERALATDPPAERTAARRRHFDHLLRCAYEAVHQMDPFGPATALPLGDTDAALPGEVTTPAQASQWFDVHHATLVNAIESCVRDGTTDRAWMLLECMAVSLTREGRWDTLADCAAQLLRGAATGRTGAGGTDSTGTAVISLHLGDALERLGVPGCHHHLRTALEQFRASGDIGGQARAHLALARWHGQRKEADALRRFAGLAIRDYQRVGDMGGLATTLNALGWYALALGDSGETLDACYRALVLFERLGNTYGQADVWDTLAHAHQERGETDQALHCFERAIDFDRRLHRYGHRINQAQTLLHYGDLSARTHRLDQATAAWTTAVTLLGAHGHPLAAEALSRLAK